MASFSRELTRLAFPPVVCKLSLTRHKPSTKMKTGKITAKLRDAVPVCLMVNGEEVKRYKNIELPDMLKEVEMTDFHFNVHMDGKITFEIHYEEGVLPEVFPEARTRVSRAAKAAAKAAMQQPAEDETVEDEPEDSQPTDAPQTENPGEPTTEETEPEGIKTAYNNIHHKSGLIHEITP